MCIYFIELPVSEKIIEKLFFYRLLFQKHQKNFQPALGSAGM